MKCRRKSLLAPNPTEFCAHRVFAKNARNHNREDLARAALKKSVELRANNHGAKIPAEIECLKAIYAYERILTAKNGRTTKASRTWQMIDRHGILQAVERAVNRTKETVGYTALLDMGLEDFAFESVVVRYPELFSMEAVDRCKRRIAGWNER